MTATSGTPLSAAAPDRRRVIVTSGRVFVAEALAELLRGHDRVRQCERAADGAALQAALAASEPLDWLIDLDDPGADVSRVVASGDLPPGVRRVGFYDAFTARHAETAFELGVTTLFPLTSSVEHIVAAVLSVDRRTSSITEAEGLTRDQLSRLSSLTPREVEVLEHLAAGRSVKVIASLLGITSHTVETHKRRTFQKLGVQQQGQAVAMAVEAGIVGAA